MPSQKFLKSYVQINITDVVVELMFGLSGLLSIVKGVSPKDNPIPLNTCWFSSYTFREDVSNSYQLLFTIWPTISFWGVCLDDSSQVLSAQKIVMTTSSELMLNDFFYTSGRAHFRNPERKERKIESSF